MDRSELQRLYDRAVGDGRRYWADSYVQNLVTAVGEYLAQDDPSVEIAYLKAAIADLKAGAVIPGQNSEQPQRVQPSREDVGRALFGFVADYLHGGNSGYGEHTDAILALFAGQPTVAEVRAQALREKASEYRQRQANGELWMIDDTWSRVPWKSVARDLEATADRETEGGAR